VEDVAAVLADLGFQSGSLAAARALLVAARHPEEAPDEEDDYHHKHDDDRDCHPHPFSGGATLRMERTIAARIGRIRTQVPVASFVRWVADEHGLKPPGDVGGERLA
jgi:hypothetical protein